MTAKLPPNPDGLNRHGSGRGLKVVSKPLAKKRGASKDRAPHIADNRRKYVSASNIPAHLVATTIDPTKPLTEKAKLFVKFWAQGESIMSASARAGYGDGATYAYKLARFPQAIALYNAEKAAYEEAAQMTRKKVMDGLLDGIQMAKLIGEPSSVISGWREIGKLCGYYEPVRQRIDLNVTGNIQMQRMSSMSDAELLRVIAAGAQAELLQLEQVSDDEDESVDGS